MPEVSMGDCEWAASHPPHLWAEERALSDGSAIVNVFACTGEGASNGE